MAFFRYANIALYFTDTLWAWLLVGGLCFAIVFVFQAIALYIIASREGYKNKWMACVPFLNTYYIGVCAQKNRFYNIDTKKIGIVAAVFEFVLCALNVLFLVAENMLNKHSGVDPTIRETIFGETYYYPPEIVPVNLKWAAWIYNDLDNYITLPINIVYLLSNISLLISFFQTYACRRYVIFTITSIIFPIQGILFFIVSNNKGINYKEFVRREQARQYQQYQQYYQQNPYNRKPYERNPYERNPYDNNPYDEANAGGSHSAPPDDPFSDFGGSGSDASGGGNDPGDPFNNFDKN